MRVEKRKMTLLQIKLETSTKNVAIKVNQINFKQYSRWPTLVYTCGEAHLFVKKTKPPTAYDSTVNLTFRVPSNNFRESQFLTTVLIKTISGWWGKDYLKLLIKRPWVLNGFSFIPHWSQEFVLAISCFYAMSTTALFWVDEMVAHWRIIIMRNNLWRYFIPHITSKSNEQQRSQYTA